MTSVLVNYSPEKAFELGLVALLSEHGMAARSWDPIRPIADSAMDVVVLSSVDAVRARTALNGSATPLVAIVDLPTAADARGAFEAGATAVLRRNMTVHQTVSAISAVASGGVEVVPPGLFGQLATRLEEPPLALEPDVERFLAYATSLTIEQAGERMGYSRRQAQRRFRSICESFGFANHLDAAVAAARWGLRAPNDTGG